ncbi:MAG: ribonuclease J, partial [Cellulomonas sp.]|nr:ribonuclease J [Cellulomonas sp.]
HVHRIQQVLDAAHAGGRKVGFVGRSMVRNMNIAKDLGYLHVPDGLLVEASALDKLPADRVTLVCTGSQGEPMAALSRMANGDHQIKLTEGDTVLLASSLIPGNETAIYDVINKLTERGARVVHKGNAKVHVSGHASAGELVYCYRIVRPRHVLPIHGESKHLHANGALAVAAGVPDDNVLVVRDGVSMDLEKGKITIVGSVPADMVYVEGGVVGRATEETLRERRMLRDGGVLTVLALLEPSAHRLAEPLEFISRGALIDEQALAAATREVEKALAGMAAKRESDAADLDDTVRRAVLRGLRRRTAREPVVVALVMDA